MGVWLSGNQGWGERRWRRPVWYGVRAAPTMSKESWCCRQILSTMPGAPLCQGPWWLLGMPYGSSIHTILAFLGLSNWQGIDSNNEYLLCAWCWQ